MTYEVRISRFAHARTSTVQPLITTWDNFVQSLFPYQFSAPPDKRDLPMFSPCEFRPGQPRLEASAIRVWLGVLDCDGINDAQLLYITDRLEGLDAVLYTTYSHPRVHAMGLWKIRVCVRFSRPVEAREWESFWFAFVTYFGSCADPQTKPVCHAYFGPNVPPGTDPGICVIHVWRGLALDVDAMAQAAYGTPINRATDKIPRERLQRLAERWKRNKDPYRAEMGEVLYKVCKGDVFAEPGNVDNILFQLCQDLAKAMPTGTPASIAAHFVQSMQLMSKDSRGADPSYIIEKIERAQETAAIEKMAEDQAQISESKLRIRQAFANSDPTRDYPYTETELDDMAISLKVSREELRKRWLIQRGPLFYVLGPGAIYSPPYTDKDVSSAILRDLAPAISAGVELWTERADGEKSRKAISTLMNDHGVVAQDYVLDMRSQRAEYDGTQKLFIEAPCPMRRLTPAFDPDVAQWLEIAMGSNLANVLNWISQVTDLNSICAALLLTGAPETGKTLLAMGLARLWVEAGPTDLNSALASFNDSLARCPLILADEQLPKDFRGHDRTAELRQFIAQLSRPFKKKFYPETVILGAIRLIITANNENVMSLNEHLTAHDIQAIGDRFFHVRVSDEATTFLHTVDTKRFVAGDAIARHALYLRDHYPIRKEGRFLVKSEDRTFYRGLATKSGIRSAVLQWLIGYLKTPGIADHAIAYGVRVKGNRLLARAETILEAWGTYVTNENPPGTGRLAQALGELSGNPSRIHCLNPTTGLQAHYRILDTDHLYAWAEQTEFMTRDEITAALAVDTEDRIAQRKKLA